MFDNIGGKIKTLAKVLCWIGIVGSVIAAIGFFTSGNGITGWSMLIAGSLGSWISSFTLYALGEITENSATQTQLLTKLAQKEGIELPVLEKKGFKFPDLETESIKPPTQLLIKIYDLGYAKNMEDMLSANGIVMEYTRGVMQETIYVRCSDFQRARALIAENFKDNPKVMKGLAPETPSDN